MISFFKQNGGKTVTLYTGTSFIRNGTFVIGNIVKWGTKQVFGNYIAHEITSNTVFVNYFCELYNITSYTVMDAYDVM